jgi:hypothetical protein
VATVNINRRGRPKGKKAPDTTASRVEKFRQALKKSGGANVSFYFDAAELEQLELIKRLWNLPQKTGRSEVIKAMTCVLAGGAYIIPGHQVTASTVITERSEYPDWLADIYTVP